MEMDEKRKGYGQLMWFPTRLRFQGTALTEMIWVPQAFSDLPRLCYVQFRFYHWNIDAFFEEFTSLLSLRSGGSMFVEKGIDYYQNAFLWSDEVVLPLPTPSVTQ